MHDTNILDDEKCIKEVADSFFKDLINRGTIERSLREKSVKCPQLLPAVKWLLKFKLGVLIPNSQPKRTAHLELLHFDEYDNLISGRALTIARGRSRFKQMLIDSLFELKFGKKRLEIDAGTLSHNPSFSNTDNSERYYLLEALVTANDEAMNLYVSRRQTHLVNLLRNKNLDQNRSKKVGPRKYLLLRALIRMLG